MPAQRVEQWVEPVTEAPVALNPHPLVVVVGFDGSDSAYRALDAATRLISGRTGRIVPRLRSDPAKPGQILIRDDLTGIPLGHERVDVLKNLRTVVPGNG